MRFCVILPCFVALFREIVGNDLLCYNSQKVGNIQKLLKIQGFYQGAIDGKFAASTKASLLSFQKSKGLDADGIAGLKTWAALMRKSPDLAVPPPTPAPTPAPPPTPPKPTPAPSIVRLTEVFSSYQGKATQDTALIWLQTQVSTSVLGEFAQKWRTTAVPPDTNLRLIDVCKFYRGLASQDQALEWLQTQVSPTVIAEFAQKWRSQSVAPSSTIRLIDVCKFYRAAPNQNQALDWLQGQISAAILLEFFRKWQTVNRDGK